MGRRRTAALAALVAAIAVVVGPTTTATATPYRFWSYWKWSGSSWTFMNVGPQGNLPAGTVIGWRFAIQQDSANASPPRSGGDFTALCDGHNSGIGVVIDYGVRSDAPSGESPPRSTPRGFCATEPNDTNGYRATAEHAALRVNDSGLVCGIDGYPKTECGAVVAPTPSPTAAPSPARHQSSTSRHHDGGSGSPTGKHATATPYRPPTAVARTTRPPSRAPAAPRSGDAPPSPTPTPTLDIGAPAPSAAAHGGNGVGLIVGLAVAAALAVGAALRFRSRT